MPISYVGSGSVGQGSGGVTPSLPAGVTTDDLLIMVVETDAANTPTPPAGWAAMPESGVNGGGTKLTMWYIFHTGSAPPTSVPDPGDHIVAQIAAFRGVDTTSPFDTSAQRVDSSGGASSYFPGITTTVDYVVLFCAATTTDDLDVFSNYANAGSMIPPITQILSGSTTSFNDGSLRAVWGFAGLAGATGDVTFDHNLTNTRVMATVGLVPADGGAVPPPQNLFVSGEALEVAAAATPPITVSGLMAEAAVATPAPPISVSGFLLEVIGRIIPGGIWHVRQAGSFVQAPATVRQDPDWLDTLTRNLDGAWNPEV